jgi:antitoxin HicB
MVRYPITLRPDVNGTVVVAFPDFPEAHTFGNDKAEALSRAIGTLETIIDAHIRDRQDIPDPSRITDASVTLPSLVATKVQLYKRMRHEHVSKSELARRLNVHLPQVDRLLDVRHGSKLEQLEAAAHALGGLLDVVFVVPDDVAAATVKAAGERQRISRRRRSGLPRLHAGVSVVPTRTTDRRADSARKKKKK